MSTLAAQLSKLLGPHTTPTSKGWWNYCHKRCGDKKFRLGINPRNGRFRCFNCGLAGKVKDLLPGLKGEIAPLLDAPRRPIRPPPTGLPWAPIPANEADLGPVSGAAVKYLQSRGIPHAHAVRLGLGYGTKGSWIGRVIHPHYAPDGTLAGWQGRVTYDPSPDDEFPVKKIRFATKRDVPTSVRIRTPNEGALYLIERVPMGGPILMAEGPYSAIHAERVVPSVALFGSHLAEQQLVRILARRPTAIYLALDPDKSGKVWNKDMRRWEADPRLTIVRMIRQRSDVPVYVIDYSAVPEWEGDLGGKEDKTPHTTEELRALVSAAVLA